MTELSKFYEEPLCWSHCSQLLVHPGKTCSQFFVHVLYRNLISSGKYFLPLLISPCLLKFRQLNREVLLKTLKFYVQATGCASMVSTVMFLNFCILRNLLGRFYKYSVLPIPSLSYLLTSCIFPQRVINLFLLTTSQSSIELIIRRRSNILTRLISDSKLVKIFIFMLNSLIIMHFKRAKVYNGFWFIQPNKSGTQDDIISKDVKLSGNSRSQAGQTFRRDVLDGIKPYMLLGIPLDLLGIIMHAPVQKGTTGFWKLLAQKLKNIQLRKFQMTGFLTMYVGLYRLSYCMLPKYLPTLDEKLCNMIAGFIGGISYICLNKITIYSLSQVIAINILSNYMRSHLNSEKYPFARVLKRLKFSNIIIGINLGLVAYAFFFSHNLVNSVGRGFINAITDTKAMEVFTFLRHHSVDEMMAYAKAQPILNCI